MKSSQVLKQPAQNGSVPAQCSFFGHVAGLFSASARLAAAHASLQESEETRRESIGRAERLIASLTKLNEEAKRCLAETDKVLAEHRAS